MVWSRFRAGFESEHLPICVKLTSVGNEAVVVRERFSLVMLSLIHI